MRSVEQSLLVEYRRRFEANSSYRDRVWQTLCRSYFRHLVPPDSTVLDVGCGWGEFINNVEAGAKFAMDLNPDAGARLLPGIEFFHQDCSTPWPVPPDSLDVVFSSNFIEHLPNKQAIERTFVEAHKALKPGGSIVLLGPNVRFVPGAYWDFWDHYVPLTDRSVVEGLELAGFTPTRRIDRFLPYTMSDGREAPIVFVEAYLRLPFAWKFFGKQFLVVAKK